MKNKLLIFTLCISALWSNSVLSYLKEGDTPGMQQAKPKPGNIEKSAQCAPATQKYFMKFNDVNALIENGGSMFQNRQSGSAAYEVPKGSNRFAIFSGSLWMGGTDVNNQLKLAALTFRKGNDFWPGPLGSLSGGDYDASSPVGTTVIRPFGGATITPDQCLAYDKFDTITKALVIKFNNWWECQHQGQGLANVNVHDAAECVEINNEPLSSTEWLQIKNWPALGDASLGEDHYLAPFYDRNSDQLYDPTENGDYPWYDDIVSNRDDIICGADRRVSLYGDATLWWIFNDKGNIHTETTGDPIGMEIRAQAFTFSTSDEVNRMTFFNYELINRGTTTLYNTYFSQFLDPDVGLYSDDYVGCDVSRGLGYAYNGDDYDQDGSGKFGYGENPPAIGVDFFEGPYLDPDGIDNIIYNLYDADHGAGDTSATYPYIIYSATPVSDAILNNGIIYKGIGIGYSDKIVDNERFGMRRFSYFTSTAVYPFSDPSTAAQYYNFMKGNWANGVAMTYGGTGQSPTGQKTSYIFPDDSDPLGWATEGAMVNDQWSEKTAGNAPGDRRFVQSAGPFTLKPGAFNNITVGIVYGRGTEGTAYASVGALKKADTKAQALFDNCFKILDPPMAPKLTIQELDNGLVLMLDNPSSSNNNKEKYSEVDKINITMDTLNDGTIVTDAMKTYKFEGYMIYQLKNSASSAADIGNEDKARLVAQCDIQNGVSKLINFEYDEGLGFDNPKLKVNGSNTGIKHSFKLTKDAFASGENTLVNNKTYYYVAVAYAYNQYKKYDPNDPLLLDGQKIPFISSRLGYNGVQIQPVSAVPHNPTLEADGTDIFADYGDSPLIKRLDGTGNGNRNLELTQDSKDKIVQYGFLNEPIYDNQSGPINVKVIDPLNVADGYFELKFRDYVAPQSLSINLNGADTASWTLYHYDSEGGTLIDSVNSSVNISSGNEQLIPQWGVSVEIKQTKYKGTMLDKLFADPITSSVTFSDSSTRWLFGVPDDGSFFPTNWIRTGSYNAPTADLNPSK